MAALYPKRPCTNPTSPPFATNFALICSLSRGPATPGSLALSPSFRSRRVNRNEQENLAFRMTLPKEHHPRQSQKRLKKARDGQGTSTVKSFMPDMC